MARAQDHHCPTEADKTKRAVTYLPRQSFGPLGILVGRHEPEYAEASDGHQYQCSCDSCECHHLDGVFISAGGVRIRLRPPAPQHPMPRRSQMQLAHHPISIRTPLQGPLSDFLLRLRACWRRTPTAGKSQESSRLIPSLVVSPPEPGLHLRRELFHLRFNGLHPY